jgi:cbb3-type cytochrome oxidase subunit 3
MTRRRAALLIEFLMALTLTLLLAGLVSRAVLASIFAHHRIERFDRARAQVVALGDRLADDVRVARSCHWSDGCLTLTLSDDPDAPIVYTLADGGVQRTASGRTTAVWAGGDGVVTLRVEPGPRGDLLWLDATLPPRRRRIAVSEHLPARAFLLPPAAHPAGDPP